jgi:hypothetical protein
LSEKDYGGVPHNMILITQKRRYIYKREGERKTIKKLSLKTV